MVKIDEWYFICDIPSCACFVFCVVFVVFVGFVCRGVGCVLAVFCVLMFVLVLVVVCWRISVYVLSVDVCWCFGVDVFFSKPTRINYWVSRYCRRRLQPLSSREREKLPSVGAGARTSYRVPG